MNTNMSSLSQDGIWKIEGYGTHDGSKWNKVRTESANMYLILKNMNLMLTRSETLIDHISLLTNNVRMVLKNESLGIAVTQEGTKMRKIRVKFASTNLYSGTVVAKNCAEILRKYVPIQDLSTNCSAGTYDSTADSDGIRVSLSQHISELLNKNTTLSANDRELASQFPLEEMVEICILDVNFPSLVAEVNDLLRGKLGF